MENTGSLQTRVLKNKAQIFQQIVAGVREAVEKDSDVHYITDLNFLGTDLTFKLPKESWIYSLDKARVFFESTEEYDQSIICRDLIKTIKERGAPAK